MEPFVTLSGIAAPLPAINVDTDQIIPKQFLKTIKRSGLGQSLFFDLRYDDDGQERPEFVLNQLPWREARILVTQSNFGCGSSREHAPWALLDFGIRCIIAPSFADIFFNNCFKNGVLPITLPQPEVDVLLDRAAESGGIELVIDLEEQTITAPGLEPFHFDVDPFRKQCLLQGLDDIGLTLQKADRIDAFEKEHLALQSWLSR